MFRRILVPVDGSEQSLKGLRYAIHWTKNVKGGLTLLHVIDIKLLEGPLLRDVSSILGVTPWTNYQNQIHALLEERGKQILNLCETECQKNEISCEKILKTGIISRTILEESELYDIIIIGKSGEHSRWSEGFLGGTTQAVIRRSKRPVLITNQAEFRRGPFILAYDGSPSAKEALRISTELAKIWDVTCHVVYVVNKPEEEIINEAIKYLKTNEVPFLSHTIHESSPSTGILDMARKISAELIVMGAFGKNRVHEWLLGSNTHSVIHTSTCPTLLTRLG